MELFFLALLYFCATLAESCLLAARNSLAVSWKDGRGKRQVCAAVDGQSCCLASIESNARAATANF